MKRRKEKKKYVQPRITHHDKVEVLAAVCDSSWLPNRTCMVVGQPACQKTRF
ncbi:MAG: hypothetical protein V2A34_14700 [Lentisphaerota bacterium]